MIGSWSLFTDALMKWEPGKVKIVAMDALPAELPYVRQRASSPGSTPSKPTSGATARSKCWPTKSFCDKEPKDAIEYSPLLPVTSEQADAFGENWKKWLRE